MVREADVDLETARIVMDGWRRAFNDEPATTAAALKAAADPDSPLHDALALLAEKNGALPSPRAMGAFLRRYRDRIVSGRRITVAGESHKARLWKVEGDAS